MNPYKHLAVKIRALLATESKLTAEERQQNQWQLFVKFAGTQIMVGKGDVNTIFYKFGEGERKAVFPDTILDRLDALSTQKHYRYTVVVGEKRRGFWSLSQALQKVDAARGAKVYGHGDGDTETLVSTAIQGLNGYEWKTKK